MKSLFNESVAAIIVTYNPVLSDLEFFLFNLSLQVGEVIIVDNASFNIDEIVLIKKKFSNVNLIKNNENEGLAFAQNQGIEYICCNKNYKFLMIFDQDSNVSSDFVSLMTDSFYELKKLNYKIAALGPAYYDAKTNELYPATKYFGPFIKRIKPVAEPVNVTFVIASGSFMPVDIFNEIGLMNEQFFIDYIDVEWCLRAKSKGYDSFLIPSVKMVHSIGDNRMNFLGRSISIHSPLRRYYLIRNSFIISKLNYVPLGYKIREIFFNFIRFFVFIFVSKNKNEILKFSFRGVIDGIKGKSGKREFE